MDTQKLTSDFRRDLRNLDKQPVLVTTMALCCPPLGFAYLGYKGIRFLRDLKNNA
jgi:hypothetical protein